MLILPLSNQVHSSNITTDLGIEYRPVVFTFSIIQVGASAFNGQIYCRGHNICNSTQNVALIIILKLCNNKTLVKYNFKYSSLCS